MIRGARAGQVAAQLALGERYLLGGGGLPQSMATALHWLDKAAHQNSETAWMLIGRHIPYEVAALSANRASLCQWYERAFDAGLIEAGLVFAKLVLAQSGSAIRTDQQHKALKVLKTAAQAGQLDAQRLLIEITANTPIPEVSAREDSSPTHTNNTTHNSAFLTKQDLAKQAWDAGDQNTFLHWALTLANEIAARHIQATSSNAPDMLTPRISKEEAQLLSRCAQALSTRDIIDTDKIQLFWELAAHGGDESAPFSLGLWFAKIDENGARRSGVPGAANFKKAIHWLTLAGERGIGNAWFALSRIYLKPEFSKRNLVKSQHYLELAAEMGNPAAQLECGINAWRSRREQEFNDVRAAYWLQKAAAQGSHSATLLLNKVAQRAKPAPWASVALQLLTREMLNSHHLLVARIELAALFGLTRAEALLLDLKAADQGHCLVVDIRANYGRGKRRLVLLHTAQERQELDRIAKIFENIDTGLHGQEGNYRQRQYRLKSLLPELGSK